MRINHRLEDIDQQSRKAICSVCGPTNIQKSGHHSNTQKIIWRCSNAQKIRLPRYDELGNKFCSKCKDYKPISSFYKDKNREDGFRLVCKDCINKAQREYYENNKSHIKGRNKKTHIKRKYGLEWEEYLSLIEKGCEVCGKKENGRTLSIDHCHKTGRVRGALCSKCNSLLGFANDDLSILKNAIVYLEG